MERYATNSEQETEAAAAELAKRLRPGDVIAFRGELGAGKTAFTRGLARGLGIAQDVASPTFALLNEYRGPVTLYHFDMYRIQDEDSLYSTGFFDYLDGDGILVVEWSENIPWALPEDVITVTLERTGENERAITVEGGARF